MRDEKRVIVALNTVPGLRAVLFHRALSTFGTAAGILEAGRKGLFRLPGAGPAVRKSLAGLQVEEVFAGEVAIARQRGVDIVTLFDANYPANLLQVPDPPPVLYVRGTLLPVDSAAVAIVGSRAATAYGRVTAGRLAGDLASCGLTVVSGLARGIDSCAHRGALEAGGRTIAVLGSGLDRPYPPENRSLIEEIASSGAVISEFPFATIPEKRNFPERNRTISGLARGVVVVEAAARSGALITAGCALDQGREVFAVPGNVTSPLSAGPNALLRDGARLAESARDILEEFPDLPSTGSISGGAGRNLSLSEEERSLLSRLDREPMTLDEVIRQSPLPSSRTAALLTALEIKGLVRQFAGRRFVRH